MPLQSSRFPYPLSIIKTRPLFWNIIRMGFCRRSPSSFILTAQTRWFSVRRKLLQKTAGYQLQVDEGYIVVYENSQNQVFEYTDIPLKLCQKSCKVKCCWESRLKPLMSFIIFWRIIPVNTPKSHSGLIDKNSVI